MMKTKNRREIVCQFSRKKIPERSSAQISLAESSPGESRGFSREWREKVAASLLENAATSHQLVVKQMEKICCDLESRCRNVEEPLRRVEEERDSLDSQLQEAKRLNMDLDLQAIESSELITRLKTDLSQLADREQNSSREAQTLANDLHALQTEFSAMKQEVEETAELDRTRAKTRELDLMAIVTERCDQLEELQMEMENLRLENIKLKEGSQLMVAENDVVVQDRNALRSEISRLRQDLEDRNTWIHEKDDHIQALNNTNRSLTGDIQVIQLNVRSVNSFCDAVN
jgi:chromosome segregation ATPase